MAELYAAAVAWMETGRAYARLMEWKGVYVGDKSQPTVLEVDGVGVVRLHKRIDGSWFAVLDYHRPGSNRMRSCTSYEAGCRGAEMWAERHAARLAEEAIPIRARWARLPLAADRPARPSMPSFQPYEHPPHPGVRKRRTTARR